MWLSKIVPHGAGLGGGSADAAAVLRSGIAQLANLGVTIEPDRVAAAALGVGSDVPALLSLTGQRLRGRGDRIEALTIPTLHLAIASTTPSSTSDTYAAVAPDVQPRIELGRVRLDVGVDRGEWRRLSQGGKRAREGDRDDQGAGALEKDAS